MEKALITLSERIGHSVGRRGFLKLGLAGAAALAAPMVAPRLVEAAAAVSSTPSSATGGGLTNPIPRAHMLMMNPHSGFAVSGGAADPGATASTTAAPDAAVSAATIRGCQCTYLGQCTDGCGRGCPFGRGNIFFCDYYYCSGSGCDQAGYVCSSCYCAQCN